MFDRVLKFFIENYKINYALFFLLLALGGYAYTQIPKEISPTIEPDSISVRGSYPGASADLLNKIAVQEIEDKCKNIDGIDAISSVISPGKFSITLELDKREDKNRITDDVKDAISLVAVNLPSDMDEPLIRGVGHARAIMQVSILSSSVPRSSLIAHAQELKRKLLSIKDVADVTIFGDSEQFYEILIDEKKVNAYNLSLSEVLKTLSGLSNIFPLGQIENKNEKYYISTYNGKKVSNELEETILNINDQQILLTNIANVKKRYEDSSTLASMNAKNSITLAISQNPKGDAITIAEEIKGFISSLNNDDIQYNIRVDQSPIIKDSLNIIISNILLGIIVISLLTMILINVRIAFIIALGIPTSFVMGAIYFYFTGYSINVNSLIGVLIAIGLIVDDAIVVSENIQQYIEKGYPPKEAAFLGTKEMAKPVTIASLTTLFSFIPLLMISGTLGEIIRLIPIAFSALIIASLLESFIFLPIHATHTLNKNSRTLSWQKINGLYSKLLRGLITHQKSFLLLFFTVVPVLLYVSVKESKFHMFEKFDSPNINITFKAGPTAMLEDSLKVIQTIEKDILEEKERFSVKHVSSTAGYRRSATGSSEIYPYVGYISIELENKKASNLFEKYITPLLSPYADGGEKVRAASSQEISADLRKWLQERGYQQQFDLNNLMVLETGMKNTKADIMVGVVSDNYQKAMRAIREIEGLFSGLGGIKYYGNTIKLGPKEIKLKINSYGESLGITEEYVGAYISKLFLSTKIGSIFDDKELIDVKVKSLNYQDDLNSFKNLEIPLKNNIMVVLKEVCEFQMIESLESLVKDDGETTFYFYANIDALKTTAGEVLELAEPTFSKLKSEGIKLKFKGEREQKNTLEIEMVLAAILALVLIFMAILYLFNSIRETLIVMSVIPFSLLGVYAGHSVMGLHISLPSLIGALGLAGVIVNDGIIMMSTLKMTKTKEDIYALASKRLRPIMLTSITTIIGLSSLIFFATQQAVTFQPLAVAIGFGLFWGTLLNLFYLPVVYNFLRGRDE
jgi:HAE1 family hydrophobic/amphiphilic exporter-1